MGFRPPLRLPDDHHPDELQKRQRSAISLESDVLGEVQECEGDAASKKSRNRKSVLIQARDGTRIGILLQAKHQGWTASRTSGTGEGVNTPDWPVPPELMTIRP